MNFHKAFEAFRDGIYSWFDGVILALPNFTAAIFALIIFLVASRFTKILVYRLLDRINTSQPVKRLSANSSAFVITLIGVIIALGIMKLDTTVTSLLTGAGIVGLGISFAFQDVIANIFSGILIAFQKPFDLEDYIESNGVYGVVKKIGLRQVEILDLDGKYVWIPARHVLQNVLKNYSQWKIRRVEIQTGISYGDDLDKVKKVTLEAIQRVNGILTDKPIKFYYTSFGDSSIDFSTFFWINFNQESDFLEAQSEAIIAIKKAYNDNGITITFPITTLDFGIKGGQKLSEMLNNSNQK